MQNPPSLCVFPPSDAKKTSDQINKILRKVVTEKEGTAKLADIHGYFVGGKTGTSQNYTNKNENLNSFISIFPSLLSLLQS